jgi:tetratricopeptide (TPR) repeat protein
MPGAGVKTLIDQARYWEGKGRHDLAVQAWHRVQDGPGQCHGPRRCPPPPPRPPRPAEAPAKPACTRAARRAARPAPAPAAATPAPAPRPAPPLSSADAAGQARLAGFNALKENDVDAAQRDFQSALSRNKRDPDALGGMGLVYMKRGRFGEARDALAQASDLGDASKWKEALTSARYFASLQDAQAMVARRQTTCAQGHRGADPHRLQPAGRRHGTAGRHLRAAGPLCRCRRPLSPGR